MEFTLRYWEEQLLQHAATCFIISTPDMAHPLFFFFLSHTEKNAEAMLLNFIWFIFLNID